jgi:hypothetical protein
LFTATDSALKTPAGSKSLAKFRDEHAGEFAMTDGSDDELDADYQINSGDEYKNGDDGEYDDESNKGDDGESDDESNGSVEE